MRVLRLLLVALLMAWSTVAPAASQASGTTYRVFLISGEPLPSYGEPVMIGDRVIFNLLVGAPHGRDVQLVSLPASTVDTERTLRYSQAMRASHYAATRGEADYAALTAEVARVLDQLTAISGARRRLALAEDARRELLAWSESHYHYRVDDIRELASLFDGVITELRIAAGEPGIAFELIARPAPYETLLPEPTPRESAALALVAARTADIGAERVEILKLAASIAKTVDDPAVHQTIAETLTAEVKAGTAYAALTSALRTRADAARRRGDVTAVQRLTTELARQDRQLGQRRPAEVRELNAQLAATVAATRAFRAALDAHSRQLASLRLYDRRVQPLLDRIDRLGPSLSALREMRGMTPGQISSADAELLRLTSEVRSIRPPAAQAGIHVSFQNVLRIAREAFARRRQARSSQAAEMREASAAAAGALLLAGQLRQDLAASLRRPSIQ